jgi:hypothetical protein
MTVPLTDEQVAPLRAQLAGNLEEHQRLLAQLNTEEIQTPYRKLVSAAFFIAAERRFPKGSTRGDVTNFVADARSRTEEARRSRSTGSRARHPGGCR